LIKCCLYILIFSLLDIYANWDELEVQKMWKDKLICSTIHKITRRSFPLMKRYANLDKVKSYNNLKDIVRWRRERRKKKKIGTFTVPQAEHKELSFLKSNRTHTTITWIGHSTFLIQTGGLNILTDPVWANRMGLDTRLTDPGLRIADLPRIDAVVISHGHYDHLHFPTLRRLGTGIPYFVPEGLGRLFHKKSFSKVKELSWWDKLTMGGVDFHFVPAQHWTRRTLTDINTSHWGGWVMAANKKTIYFAGDTGYFRGFKDIGNKFSIDYALMPIGAYEPEWIMSTAHTNPEDAVRGYTELGAKHFIPMHYGTFRLADDTPREALDRLQREWKRLKLSSRHLKILKLGETLTEKH
jgi:L-ascorbate metabolism protein UlaG (beta-lactamase superfamily)